MALGNLLAAIFIGLLFYATHGMFSKSFAVLPSLFFLPLAAGFVAAWIWRPLDLSAGRTAGYSMLGTLMGMAIAYFLFGEGRVCLIIIGPLYFLLFSSGAEIRRRMQKSSNRKLRLSFLPLLFVFGSAEMATRTAHESVVVDEILIQAPPDKVWPHVLAFQNIPAPADFWLFRLGLPYPVSTTNSGNFPGADRACIFSGNAIFREKVSAIIPSQQLTFDIVESPADPELMGHLDARRGQFILKDNHDGTTTLRGSTWYSLHVRPAAYFDAWTHYIFRAVHLRVMNNVKRLAEYGT